VRTVQTVGCRRHAAHATMLHVSKQNAGGNVGSGTVRVNVRVQTAGVTAIQAWAISRLSIVVSRFELP